MVADSISCNFKGKSGKGIGLFEMILERRDLDIQQDQ